MRNQVLYRSFSKDRIELLLISFLKSAEVLRDIKQKVRITVLVDNVVSGKSLEIYF